MSSGTCHKGLALSDVSEIATMLRRKAIEIIAMRVDVVPWCLQWWASLSFTISQYGQRYKALYYKEQEQSVSAMSIWRASLSIVRRQRYQLRALKASIDLTSEVQEVP